MVVVEMNKKPKVTVIDIMKLSPKKGESSPKEMDFEGPDLEESDEDDEDMKANRRVALQEFADALKGGDMDAADSALSSYIYNCK